MLSETAVLAVTALAALLPTVRALGIASIQNSCSVNVYVQSTINSVLPETIVVGPGDTYTEPYRTEANNGGVSLKITLVEGSSDITQFEYTVGADGNVYYDMSNIDGHPFELYGMILTPSDPSCPVVTCPAGVQPCLEAYNLPFDDWCTKGCQSNCNLDLVLCPGGSGGDSAAESTGSSTGGSTGSSTEAGTGASPTAQAKEFNRLVDPHRKRDVLHPRHHHHRHRHS